MNIIFFGSDPWFSEPVLEAILKEKHQVVLIVTKGDVFKNFRFVEGKTAEDILRFTIYDLRFTNNNRPDAIVLAAFGPQFLPTEVLNWPKYGCLNVHASLLPRWRGASPVFGAIANGDLQGNRFIITLRSPESFSESTSLVIRKKLQNIQEEGFWNFFSFQRFGTPRLLSHKLGLYIIKGNFEGAVRLFLAHQSQRELPYFKHIRKNIEDHWRDWATIRTLLDPFPYHFSLELKLVNHLQEHSEDFLGALQSVPDQVRLWIYAYDSYLFNKTLSRCIREGEVSLSLPLLTSFSPHDWEPYKTFLEEDGVDIPSRHYKKFPFVRVESRTWPVLQQAEIHNLIFQDKLAIFSFSLPKGSYATSLLMNFFTLASGIPVVPGISPEQIDAKNMLGLGSLRPTLDRFQKVLTLREHDLSREFEA